MSRLEKSVENEYLTYNLEALGHYYEVLRNITEALEAYTKAIRSPSDWLIEQRDSVAFISLAKLLCRLAAAAPEIPSPEVTQTLEPSSVPAQPSVTPTPIADISSLDRTTLYTMALETVREASGIHPVQVEAYVQQARIIYLSRLENLATALHALDIAESYAVHECDTAYISIWRYFIYNKTGDCELAEESLSKAIAFTQDPDSEAYTAAAICALLNDTKGAVSHLTTVFGQAPGAKYEVLIDMDFDNIRNTADFQDLLRQVSVFVNAKSVKSDQTYRTDDDILVSLSALSEVMGFYVNWYADSAMVELEYGSLTLRFVENSGTAILITPTSRHTITLRAPMRIINGSCAVPVIAIAEAFGAEVHWEPVSGTLNIYNTVMSQMNNGNIPAISALTQLIIDDLDTQIPKKDPTYLPVAGSSPTPKPISNPEPTPTPTPNPYLVNYLTDQLQKLKAQAYYFNTTINQLESLLQQEPDDTQAIPFTDPIQREQFIEYQRDLRNLLSDFRSIYTTTTASRYFCYQSYHENYLDRLQNYINIIELLTVESFQ